MAAGGGLFLGVYLPGARDRSARLGPFQPNAFLRVAPEWVPAVQGALILAAVVGDVVGARLGTKGSSR